MGILEFQPDLFDRAWPITTPVDHEVTGETSAVVASRPVEDAISPARTADFFPFAESAPVHLVCSDSIDDHAILLRWLATGDTSILPNDTGADISLSVGGESILFSEIDAPLVCSLNWQILTAGPESAYHYVAVYVGGQPVLMHRLLTGARGRERVDHINGNTLDNRRANLRLCTHAQNMKNRRRHKNAPTIYKGICKRGNGWRAVIRNDGVYHYSGTFHDPLNAARAYDCLAREHHGEYARLNFPNA